MSPEVRRVRVLIADDHALVRSGLRSILDLEPEIEVIGEAGDGHEALAQAQELLPDVILMDINMGDWDGVTATRRVRNSVPSARVIVLTNYDEDDLVFSSIRAGASGYLLKEVTGSQLANAIRTVADGFSLIYPSVAKRGLQEDSTEMTPGTRGTRPSDPTRPGDPVRPAEPTRPRV